MPSTRLHYGWVVIFTSSLVAIASLGFARMSYTLILPAMKDGLTFSYTKLGVLETGNFVGYLRDITGSFVDSFLLACVISLVGAVLSFRPKGGPANKLNI